MRNRHLRLAAQDLLNVSKRRCFSLLCVPRSWAAAALLCLAGLLTTVAVWLSEGSSLAGLPWLWYKVVPTSAAANVVLLVLIGVSTTAFAPSGGIARPLLPLRAKTIIFYFWFSLNVIWFLAGIYERDFTRKPKWLRHPSATQYSEGVSSLLRLFYGLGMAACWPLLANLALLLAPVERALTLLGGLLGSGHEEGVLAHAWVGSAVWGWATAHALLTQAPMLAAGLWRIIVLPAADGTETKGTSNFMGLMAWLLMCALGLTSLAPVRRAAFNAFQLVHITAAPVLLLAACMHDSKVFWYGMLGAVLYGADLVQRCCLRRRKALATATVYPLPLPLTGDGAAGADIATAGAAPAAAALKAAAGALAAAPPPPYAKDAAASAAVVLKAYGTAGGGAGAGGGGKFVVLRVHTSGPPGCCAGQHVWIRVPAVSRWEAHPYSVAASDDRSFALIVKGGGDWERRLCRLVEGRAAEAAEAAAVLKAGTSQPASTQIEVVYEGLYGTPDLQAAAASADTVLLFAGGAGVTPLASLLQALLVMEREREREEEGEQGWPSPPGPPAPALQSAHNSANGGGANGALAPPSQAPAMAPGVVGTALGAGPVHAAAALLPSPSPSGQALWGAPGAAAVAASAEAVTTEGLRSGAASWGDEPARRVHLVWAVTQQSDAEPLLPLLRAAAARGWAVDLHCTRAPALRGVRETAETPPLPQQQLPPLQQVPTHGSRPHIAVSCCEDQSRFTSSDRAATPPPAGRVGGAAAGSKKGWPLAALFGCAAAAGGSKGKSAWLPPWQLHGLACWAVTALAAAVGALCSNLGSAAVGITHCTVLADAATAADAAAASGADAGTEAIGRVAAWVSSVRAAFAVPAAASAALAAALGGGAAAANANDPYTSTTTTATSLWRRFLRALLLGSQSAECPPSLAAAGTGLGMGAVPKAAAKLTLRVCRAVGQAAPELCVKCDPFKPRSPLELSWPCCSVPVCFYGSKLVPMLGWAAGVALGAALGCLAWRRWAAAKAAAAAADGRMSTGGERRGSAVLAARGSRGWLRQLRRGGAAGGDGGGGARRAAEAEAEARGLLQPLTEGADGGADGDALAAAEEGAVRGDGAGAIEAAELPGLEGMVADALGRTLMPGANSCGHCSHHAGGVEMRPGDSNELNAVERNCSCGAASSSAPRVHVGRPDVAAYVRAAAAAAREGRRPSGPTFGVVVCGPESLHAAVQSAYERHLEGAFPGSWFRGFSFTT